MLDRRTLMTGLAAIPLAAALPPFPAPAFDPVAYIADLRAHGLSLVPAPERGTYMITPQGSRGFNRALLDLISRWQALGAGEPEAVSLTCDALMAERRAA